MVANDEFFSSKRLPAVLKHGILKRYPKIFFSMTGSNASYRGRGVYFDAFAGPGTYDDGSSGSPIIASNMADSVKSFDREVSCYFAESNSQYASDLRQCLASSAARDRCIVIEGDSANAIDLVLEAAKDIPLLSFVDPFGTGLGFDIFRDKLLKPRGSVPTELLLNFNIEMIRRAGGQSKDSNRKWLDTYLGGTWWQEHFSDYRKGEGESATARADKVASDFFKRLGRSTGTGYIAVPVRRKPGTSPIFLLTLFHKSPFASWKFLDVVSLASQELRKTVYFQQGDPGTLELFAPSEEGFKEQERELDSHLVLTIETNLLRLLRSQPSIPLLRHAKEVYGNTLGDAREMHVRRAWKNLAKEGECKGPKSGRIYEQTLTNVD